MQARLILGIETSCDETAAAILRHGSEGVEILSDIVWSQIEEHRPYAGVVPEIAARAHVEKLDDVIAEAMKAAGVGFADLDGVAATAGPGLIGGVMVGLMTAKAIALSRNLPFIAVNHLEGHALSPRLSGDVDFPYLLLLASGGHCQFLAVEALGRYRRLGSTIDDAAGEAFDKSAKVIGLGFPGGPALEKAAQNGDSKRFAFPRPMLGRAGCDLSFAGLKTAVARQAQDLGALSEQDRADLAASFQATAVRVILDRTENALTMYEELSLEGRTLVAAGGVAANSALRAGLEGLASKRGYRFKVPPMRYCTDNAAMIALAGAERLAAGFKDPLDAPARARWPLDEQSALNNPTHIPGRKGAKA